MSLDIGTIRISQQGKDQLIKLKRATGIKNWNVLCRWAICTSLADPSPPLARGLLEDSNVEMSWKTFAGNDSVALSALLKQRARSEEVSTQIALHSHIHRGIGHLAGVISRDGSIEELVQGVDS